jgi:hypothetical protein
VGSVQRNQTAASTGGYGGLRASHAEREQAVDLLKASFVRGQLTKDELDARVGEALAARTCGQLTALTADVHSAPAEAAPKPAGAPARSAVSKVTGSCKGLAIAAGAAAAVVLVSAAALAAGAAAHSRPSPEAVACGIFYIWASPGTPGSGSAMVLNSSVTAAEQGSDRILASDLEALQAAAQADPTDQSSVAADATRVSADCVSYSS